MHQSAIEICKDFFETYALAFDFVKDPQIVEVGSQDVNGSPRQVAPKAFQYIGVDNTNGKGVDIVLKDPHILPFESNSVDMVLSSSCFEHSEFFWVTFNEIMRILKPMGLFYLNAPSTGVFHRYPIDCWRFYPDAAKAMVNWNRYNGGVSECLESWVDTRPPWKDFVGIFLKDVNESWRFERRILHHLSTYENAYIFPGSDILNFVGHKD